MFRTVPLSIIRSFSLHTAMVYVIQFCGQLASRIICSCSQADSVHQVCWQRTSDTCCQQTCMTYTIAVCTVKNSWWWTEELSETCRVSFQNKSEKLVHLIGFIIRIYHDARSHKHQIAYNVSCYSNSFFHSDFVEWMNDFDMGC